MLVTAPFKLPAGFLKAFGYQGDRRLVALYWEPSGDEACYHDGESFACGSCNNWVYLSFMRQPHVRQWLEQYGINLGCSEFPALFWLVVDTQTGEMHAVEDKYARRMVQSQHIPGWN